MKEQNFYISFDLQMFAKEGPGGEKTEDATTKKLDDTRKEGQVAKSKEINTAASLLAVFACMKIFMGFMGDRFLAAFDKYYTLIPRFVEEGVYIASVHDIAKSVIFDLIIITLPFFAIGFLVVFLSNRFQFKWMVTAKPLQPKLSKINPISGLKRMFSMETMAEMVRSIVKIVMIAYISYSVIVAHMNDIYNYYDMAVQEVVLNMYRVVLELGMKISIFFFILGIADLLFQRWKFKQDNKMTKQEVKDEYKNSEGDPKVKAQQKQRMHQASQRRMMAAVPEADVIITNPTHFAVALQYVSGSGRAPIVVAKGADFLANRIKELAKENKVEIVENKPLARMLYYNVELGSEIPAELYQAVAEVLAYVYQLQNKVG